MKIRFLLLPALIASMPSISAGELPELAKPLNIPLLLSGNFGELRNNHFHSGLDFKTQGRTGLPIYCAADGYVSRVVVSPWGFGRAIYVTHPSLGITTVYGHLQEFADKIDCKVRDIQYDREQFSVDLTFEPGEIPVGKGEKIALSGNSGSSGGPHLHMDIRDTATEDPLDPMPYFKSYIKDDVAPEIRSISLYPVKGEGEVDGKPSPETHVPASFNQPFTAWGKVIPGIKAYDKMTGTTNIYGVKHLSLKVDGKEIYRRKTDRFSFATTRAVNTLVDYAGVVNNGSWTMWSYEPAASPLDYMVTTEENGIIDINEERDYNCEWTLTDEHGNTKRVPFTIKGVKRPITEITAEGDRFNFDGKNTWSNDGIRLEFPAGTFYDDLNFSVSTSPSQTYLTPIYKIADRTIPVAGEYVIEIDLPHDTIADKQKYVLVRINGKRVSRVDSKYSNGTITGTPSALGSFAVTTDNVDPVIKPEIPASWGKKGKISFKISDNLSGVKSWRGEIDGKFALFELDGKTGRLSFVMDPRRFDKGKHHSVSLKVTDAAGNTADYSGGFTW
ncbi:M23 family metallopeptidase [Barnesiella sp. WM24]|uniref:M23 family metallopeptidase n=1 Tax=Barnesiella sp. WM24 TaxID=2558278 RepID=UPI0010717481|nr:M23 family metallopeptidase [Barnesiella sp. WM24]TFU92635.1 M23 family metallopeptidase [Barnesiella sp. WM24]